MEVKDHPTKYEWVNQEIREEFLKFMKTNKNESSTRNIAKVVCFRGLTLDAFSCKEQKIQSKMAYGKRILTGLV